MNAFNLVGLEPHLLAEIILSTISNGGTGTFPLNLYTSAGSAYNYFDNLSIVVVHIQPAHTVPYMILFLMIIQTCKMYQASRAYRLFGPNHVIWTVQNYGPQQ